MTEYDICNDFNNLNITKSNYIASKFITECGDINIIVNDLKGNEKINILYSLGMFEPFNCHVISSFYYDKHIGILEQIYCDRTEYIINEQFYSSILTNEIIHLINKITHFILYDKIFPNLYNFIMSDDEITILPESEFDYDTIKNICRL
jgi:hypothetical protein